MKPERIATLIGPTNPLLLWDAGVSKEKGKMARIWLGYG